MQLPQEMRVKKAAFRETRSLNERMLLMVLVVSSNAASRAINRLVIGGSSPLCSKGSGRRGGRSSGAGSILYHRSLRIARKDCKVTELPMFPSSLVVAPNAT
jgi:hypothetical protein